MEHNVFRDYCKAENSDDEEDNHDLQSRLYAEIYYGSNNGENVDTKENIKVETLIVDRNEFHNTTNIPIASNVNDSFGNKQISNDQTETYTTNVACNSSLIIEDDKSNIRFADTVAAANQPGISYVIDRSNLNTPCVEASEHSQKNIDCSKANDNLDPQNVPDKNIRVPVKSEAEVEFINELWSTQDLNDETTTVNHKEYSADRIETTTCVKQKIDDNSFDILKKYEYVKLFINSLYLEKYENINKELQKLEKEEEAKLRNRKQEAIVVIEDEKSQQEEQFDAQMGSTDETEKQSKYNVRAKSKKLEGSSNDSEEIMLLSSDTESDSEVSILEVPIPPKPQPPVIHVQDSDDGYEISSSDSDIEYPFNLNNKSPLKKKKKESYSNKNNTSKPTVTEDIMLNCTKVQKSASSVQEIIETSRSVHKSNQSPSKDKDSCAKDVSTNVNRINDKNLNRTDKITFVNDKEKSDVQLPLEAIINSNTVFERDKANSVSFVENVNFSNSSELSISRKRHCEDDSGPSNAKRKKGTDNENRYPETNPEEDEDGSKNEQESWTKYFFRPMSDRLKAFYNESRGQENFDIQEIQSKMSNEDLMPGLWKRRFWNVKCNNCQQEGHQAYNCPQPRKPPQCHMCGTPGHTEVRCPQKICLTCGKKQGAFRKTCESCRSLYCEMCKAIGHNSNECPDHWRKFHQTTEVSNINVPDNLSEVMKPADLLYCCNCTKRGHDSSTCHDYQWSQHFRTPAFVTNYAVESSDTNSTQQRDMIPINSYNKNTLTRNVAFPQGKSDLNGCQILFTYGDFQTKKQNGEEIIRKFTCDGTLLSSLLKNEISTSMLDQFFKIVKFELKIFRNPGNSVMLRIRTALLLSEYVYEFFIYWIKLDDEDKKLHMETIIPYNSTLALKTLTAKMQELKGNAYDLKNLYSQLKSLETLAGKTQNPSSNVSNKILDLRRKLLKAFHTKPKLSKLAVRLTRMIERLKVLAKKPKASSTNIKLPMFVEMIIIYNKLFLPRALKSTEFKQLINSCKDKKNVEKNEEDKSEKSKKQKKKNSPYETFLQNIRNFNQSNAEKQQKQKSANNNDSTAGSSKVVQNEDEQLPVAVESSLATNVISLNDGMECNIESDDLQTYNKENTGKRNTGYPIKIVLLQHSQNASGEGNNMQSVDNECASFIPLTKPVSYTVSRVENDYLSNAPCTKVRPENNTEQQMETSNSTEIIQASTSQQEDDIDVFSGKKKKSKKSRKSRWNSTEPDAQDSESSNTENQTVKTPNTSKSRWDSKEPRPKVVSNNQVNQPVKATNTNKTRWDLSESISKVSGPSNIINPPVIPPDTNMFLENSAAKVINEALVFDLPYMNNAVEEVRKRIINKNIKQEHIDVLRRLIDIEKDHRKFVSAFCNYLK